MEKWYRSLKPALEAARLALAELDEDEVPVRLRPVRKSSARTLPPPLAKALVGALNDEPWLRAKAHEKWASAGDPQSPIAKASGLFLERPEGWAEALDELMKSADNEIASRRVTQLETETETLRQEAGDAKQLIRDLRNQLETERLKAAAEKKSALERATRKNDPARVARAERSLAKAEKEAAGLIEKMGELETRVALLRRRLMRSKVAPAPTEQTSSAWSTADPIALARTLDQMAAAARPRSPEAESPTAERDPLRLSPGISPDSGAAVSDLLTRKGKWVLLVDGYNVTFQLGEEGFGEAAGRMKLEAILDRVARQAKGPLGVVVFYDSTLAELAEPLTDAAGVEIRFVPDADEAVRQAAASGPNCVVISSDREVRDGALQSGALVLWSEALVEWASAR